jgi:imidazolonepropionase-like amidohydrolase
MRHLTFGYASTRADIRVAKMAFTILLALAVTAESGPHILVIEGGSVVDTRTGQLLENRTVVVEGGRITRVAPAREVGIPPHAQVVDARCGYCKVDRA